MLYTSYGKFAHWNVPNLRHLTTIHYFPLSLPGLENVTTLEVTLVLHQINFSDLLSDLSKMRNLEDFTLKLVRFSGPLFQPVVIFQRTELPNVRRLKIETAFSCAFYSPSRPLMRSIFSSLFFPGTVDLHVRFSGKMCRRAPGPDFESDLRGEVMCIFRHVEQFPRVERFRLETYGHFPYEASHDGDDWTWPQLLLPLDMLPNAKHVILQSNGWLDIRDHDCLEEEEEEEEGAVLPRVPGNYVPALQTIAVEANMVPSITRWIRKVLQEQRRRGEWEEFRELIVSGGEEAHGEKVTETYVGDDAIAWCEARAY